MVAVRAARSLVGTTSTSSHFVFLFWTTWKSSLPEFCASVSTADPSTPVGAFSSNRYGLYDLGGNAREWCENRQAPGSQRGVVRDGWRATSQREQRERGGFKKKCGNTWEQAGICGPVQMGNDEGECAAAAQVSACVLDLSSYFLVSSLRRPARTAIC